MGEQGVTITLREIYDSVQEVAAGVRQLNERVERLEEKGKEADEVDERSRKALQLAESAIQRVQELEESKNWIVKSAIGALITGAIGALFYFSHH
jgi:methyl-accepting chemotaxis protein